MGCACGKNKVKGVVPDSYQVKFPNGSFAIYLTDMEARRAIRKAGGGQLVGCRDGKCPAGAA